MRHGIFRLACMGWLLVLGAAGAHAASDPGGFAGAAWAIPEANCRKLNLCSDRALPVPDAVAQERVLAGRIKAIGAIPVNNSSFAFYNDRLYLAAAFVDPRQASFESLKQALVKAHGAPRSAGPRGAAWLLGNTRVMLYQGESYHGVVYAHVPAFNQVAKIKNYPMPAPPPAPPAKRKK